MVTHSNQYSILSNIFLQTEGANIFYLSPELVGVWFRVKALKRAVAFVFNMVCIKIKWFGFVMAQLGELIVPAKLEFPSLRLACLSS